MTREGEGENDLNRRAHVILHTEFTSTAQFSPETNVLMKDKSHYFHLQVRYLGLWEVSDLQGRLAAEAGVLGCHLVHSGPL